MPLSSPLPSKSADVLIPAYDELRSIALLIFERIDSRCPHANLDEDLFVNGLTDLLQVCAEYQQRRALRQTEPDTESHNSAVAHAHEN